MKTRKKVLIAVLDWGLGHATRCIPIIREIQKKNCDVIIASNGRSLYLLENEFPGITFIKLPAYNPLYPSRGSMVFKMAVQIPKFLWAVFKEGRKIRKAVKDHGIDLVISDNRYGCRSSKVKSIFITHQLNLLIPESMKLFGKMANNIHRSFIRKFDSCWIPAPVNSIIPRLTKNENGLHTRNIGYLSALEKRDFSPKYRLCVVCSGPEPQRGLFEKMMEEAVIQSGYTSIIIRGKTEVLNPVFRKDEKCTIVNHYTSKEMNEVYVDSELIISRSGYSTVMDLMKLGKKAIFIPTPGQTEQEYLAEELMQRGIALFMKQKDFNLEQALKESEKFKGFANFEYDEALLNEAIDSVL